VKSGEIFLGGEAIKIRDPYQAMGKGLVLVPEDRKRQGLILEHSIYQNISVTILKRISNLFLLNKKKQKSKILLFKSEEQEL